ncbi:MAG: hypothetical protein IJF84_08845 [Thermoguttaceae bacterium]|nr:hypothetical protein [Thermoguttaceae bacterium]
MYDIYSNDSHVIYSEWLKPADGYELAFGVCCTYSLDLEAVMGTMLALGLDAQFNDSTTDNPVALLNGIRRMSDKLAFFCSDCAIKNAHPRFSKFTSILDNAIFEVKPESGGIFHPKLWFLHYKPLKRSKDKQPYVRLLILTKNLTFDQSLDFGIFLEAYTYEKNEQLYDNQPLVEMLEYLKNSQNKDNSPNNLNNRLTKFDELKNAFKNAGPFSYDDELDYEIPIKSNKSKKTRYKQRTCNFQECKFIPIGIGHKDEDEKLKFLLGSQSENDAPVKKNWIICVSPFLTGDIVAKLVNNVKPGGTEDYTKYGSTLLTRRESLTPGILDNVEYCFCVKSTFEDSYKEDNAQTNNSPETDTNPKDAVKSVTQGDIHAKMYFVGTGSDVYFYTGSANATHNSFYNNVEFLVRLKYRRQTDTPDYYSHCALLHLITDSESSPFEWIKKEDLQENDNPKEENYEAFQRFRNHIDNIKARVEATSENEYRVSFEEIDSYFNGAGITIAANGKPERKVDLQPGACIEGLKSTELSELYVIEISQDNSMGIPPRTFVKKIHTDGIPESRDADVMNSIINSQDNFNLWFDMFLTRRPLSSLSKTSRNSHSSDQKQPPRSQAAFSPGYYEKLLQLAIENPERFNELKSDIASFKEAPSEFKDMINVFCSAIKPESNE